MQRTISGFLATSKQVRGYILRVTPGSKSSWKPEYYLSEENAKLRQHDSGGYLNSHSEFEILDWHEGDPLLPNCVPWTCDKETKGLLGHFPVNYTEPLE